MTGVAYLHLHLVDYLLAWRTLESRCTDRLDLVHLAGDPDEHMRFLMSSD